VLLAAKPNDVEYPTLVAAFVKGLGQLGWEDGRTIRLDIRWSGGSADAIARQARSLVATSPDIIMAAGNSTVEPLLKVTRTVPVVFTIVPDPVGAGFVKSLARPGGNATGFASFEYGVGSKWLGLLKELAPRATHVAVVRDPDIAAGLGQFNAIRDAARSARMKIVPVNLRDAATAIERDVAAFARRPDGCMIVTSSALSVRHRDLLIALARHHSLPALYYARSFAARGGLIFYGPNRTDLFRRAAGYVDRILRGEKPAGLPVQLPTKYTLVVNLKTARALGLTVPQSLLITADQVIE